MEFLSWLPAEAVHILFVLFLSFLVGLEREERQSADDPYAFGGVRTFPLIGLIGYSLADISNGEVLVQAIGFAVVAAFLLMSYWHKLSAAGHAGVTSQMSGLTVYLVGALVYRDLYWVATTLTVASLVLLELKQRLEAMARHIASDDLLTFAKFLLLCAVILPLLPDESYGPFRINPYRSWVVVVAVSAVSYGSYVLQRLLHGRGGVALGALLGGAYSSTITVVVLARRARTEGQGAVFVGAMAMACGVMYLRLAGLLALFNTALLERLGIPFAALGAAALAVGWWLAQQRDPEAPAAAGAAAPRNPLELSAALLFAVLFVAMLVITQLAVQHLGRAGLYLLSALLGVSDVDPFIMGMTQSAPAQTALHLAAGAIAIAAASNNLAKGAYALSIAPRAVGRRAALVLGGLALVGLLPLLLPGIA